MAARKGCREMRRQWLVCLKVVGPISYVKKTAFDYHKVIKVTQCDAITLAVCRKAGSEFLFKQGETPKKE